MLLCDILFYIIILIGKPSDIVVLDQRVDTPGCGIIFTRSALTLQYRFRLAHAGWRRTRTPVSGGVHDPSSYVLYAHIKHVPVFTISRRANRTEYLRRDARKCVCQDFSTEPIIHLRWRIYPTFGRFTFYIIVEQF